MSIRPAWITQETHTQASRYLASCCTGSGWILRFHLRSFVRPSVEIWGYVSILAYLTIRCEPHSLDLCDFQERRLIES